MSEVTQLLAILDQAYNKPSWHGTNLRGSIRGLSPKQAAWRPAPKRHNIWENVVHAAYWKYAVSRRFVDQPRGSFRYKGSNWFGALPSSRLTRIRVPDRRGLEDRPSAFQRSAFTVRPPTSTVAGPTRRTRNISTRPPHEWESRAVRTMLPDARDKT